MSKYISKTKSKIIFKEIAEKEIENLKQGDPMSNKILADIIARREALRAQQAQRSAEKQRMLQAIHNHKASAQPKLDEFEKEYEARNLITYIQTKFFRFMVMLLKNTQHALKKVYALVPQQDFSKPWTDAELYAKYNLTDEEIAFIESMIKPMES